MADSLPAPLQAIVHRVEARFNDGIDFGMTMDDSTSTKWDHKTNPPANLKYANCWEEQMTAAQLVVDETTARDKDGVPLNFINHAFHENIYAGCRLADLFAVRGIRPNGGTHCWNPIRTAIDNRLTTIDQWIREGKKIIPYIHIFMTDGQPGSAEVEEEDARELFYQEIVYLHQELKKRGLGREAISLQMVQVGRNAGATAFFKHCDDELPARCEGVDYVDCTKYQEGTDLKLTIYKILYGSAVGDLDAGALEKVAEALQRVEAMKAAMAKK